MAIITDGQYSVATQAYVNGANVDGFLNRLLFGQELTNESVIEIQNRIYNQRAADFSESVDDQYPDILKEGHSGLFVKPGHIKGRMRFTQSDGLRRLFGASVTGGVSSAETHRQNVIRHLQDVLFYVERGIEKMAINLLRTGIVQTSSSDAFDLKKDNSLLIGQNTLPAAMQWTNAAADPLASIRQWTSKMRALNNPPTDLLLGSEAYDALMSNPKFLDYSVSRQVQFMDVDETRPLILQNQATGRIINGLTIWSCAAAYQNSNGVSTNFINPKTALLVRRDPTVNKIVFADTGRDDTPTPQRIHVFVERDTDRATPVITVHSALAAITGDANTALEAKVVA